MDQNENLDVNASLLEATEKTDNLKSSRFLVKSVVAIALFLLVVAPVVIFLIKGSPDVSNLVVNPATDNIDNAKVGTIINTVAAKQQDSYFTSEDMGITFFVPAGIEIREVASLYSEQGPVCDGGRVFPKYREVEAWWNDTLVLTIGINSHCDNPFLEDSEGTTVAFENTVDGVTYTLYTNERLGVSSMFAPVVFGADSLVGPANVDPKQAYAMIETSDEYSGALFDMAVAMASSIEAK